MPKAQKTFEEICHELQRPFGARMEELLMKALFPLLQAAARVAARAPKDSNMSSAEIE